jgi:hypothetical protein
VKHRTISGTILYSSTKPDRIGQRRGIEQFVFTRHGDGKVTLRARCEIEEPEPTVHRDVVYSLDEHGRPMDCFVRLTVGDVFMGSGWFRMTGETIECESYGPSIGRVSQSVSVGPYDGFGTHPIVGDAYLTRCLDIAKGPHTRQLRVYLPSADHRGATPPLITSVEIDLEYIGDETVEVAAGRFQCNRFRYLDRGAMGGTTHPPYDMWVTADDDALFVRGGVGGYMQTWYELIELNR